AGGEGFKVVSHSEQLARSECARRSSGRMWCGTCHDPHRAPAEPAAFFRARCLDCHKGPLPKSHPAKTSNCLPCHMPKRPAEDGGHTAFTDHRIARRPAGQPGTKPSGEIAAWREPAPELRVRNRGLALLNAGHVEEGYKLLVEARKTFPDDPAVPTGIGTALRTR